MLYTAFVPRIYLDVCCLNRPFDDQSQERIRLESEAVLLILVRLEQHQDWCWASSAVVQYEIEKTPDSERRRRVRALAAFAEVRAELTDEVVARAMEVRSWGFEAVDALHVACAEALHSDVLLTTDDGILKAARRNVGRIGVRVANPVDWLRERDEA